MSEGLFLGNRLIRLNEVESTNDYLKTVVSETKNQLEGLVVIADAQTKGRGQQGTKWLSEPGKNLCFSIYLKPKFDLGKQFLISQLTSLALVELIQSLGIEDVSIKWPNDIYIRKEKVAGMLIENSIKNFKISQTIIGVGLNVNQVKFDLSLKNPTSLTLELNRQVLNINDVLTQFLGLVEKYYLKVRVSNKSADFDSNYEALLFQRDQECDYIAKDEQVKGVIRGVDSDGKLQLEVDGKIASYDLKEVEFL